MSILKISDDKKGIIIGFGEQKVLIKHGTLKDANNIILYLVEAFNNVDDLKAILEKNPKHLSRLVDVATKWFAANPNVDLSKELMSRYLWILKSEISERIGLSVISCISIFSPRYMELAVILDGLFNGKIVMGTTIEMPIEKFDVVLLESLYTHIIDHYGSEENFINTISDEENYEINREKYEELLDDFKNKLCEV